MAIFLEVIQKSKLCQEINLMTRTTMNMGNVEVKRHVVCAANRTQDGLIICGARHWDEVMSAVWDRLNLDDRTPPEQGFIDQFGNFLTREEAKHIAIANNQPLREEIDMDIAFSENFY